MLPAKPEEVVLLGSADRFPPRTGLIELEVTEELREILYLDQAALWVVDHPPATEVHSTDKLGPPPFSPSEIWTLSSPRRAQEVRGNDGHERTRELAEMDGVYAAPAVPLPPPHRGQCHALTLTCDFGELDVQRPWVLALTGWIQYGDASANIAASQQRTWPIIPPQLEAQTTSGEWLALPVVVGMPAGKTKTILCDLRGQLPVGCRRLRLTTTFDLRWDRIALLERVPADQTVVHVVSPATAELRARGYSRMGSRAPGHPVTPDYADLLPRPPWSTTPKGWCTRYGEVRSLVEDHDGQLVIMNGGDALRLGFRAGELPPPRDGWTRTFFFRSVGWDKDQDYNVVDGDTVTPLPVPEGPWVRRYNTRWVDAKLPGAR